MASSLHSTLYCPCSSSPIFSTPKTKTLTINCPIPVRCGPRSNRGPLVKGRILSTEAILAIQSLKRVASSSSSLSSPLPNLTRLIKSDLIAAVRELLRQNHPSLALHVLSALRSDYLGQVDLNLYADVVLALSRNDMSEEIDRVVEGLEGVEWGREDRGEQRLVRAVVEAGRKESTVKICEMMRRCGCGDTWTADDYVVKILSSGLRKMGEGKLANEVEREFGKLVNVK
ncbi:hypothetical protein K2173_024269 [Erythroxylum novogranatense]|uniref:Uncharacterized protein n=1 Tax=Erythroxylum novogranatense TaxID=1862640 RepID=A0AAV8STX3_9ROSI|nr:hypothetical protein K2173_024269 [Erythroxylum novogranatense]